MDTTITDGLDRELAALKAKAADYGAQHKVIDGIKWPNGARVAVNFTADFDTMLLRRLLNEPPSQLAKGEFGGRVGIWRLIELFDSHRIKATIFTPGRICELYPESLRAAAKSGHEIADHMWEHRVPKEPELERDHLRKTLAAIEKTVGKKPVGTRSTHSRELLLEHGFIYTSEDSMDHWPNWLSAADGSKPILNLPFHYAIDDAMFFSFAWLGSDNSAQRMMDPDHVEELWWRMFEQCYRDGGYMNVCMHPFVSGRALRIAMLDRLINRMRALPGVWFPSCEEVARHIIRAHKGAK
ncbi:MAG: polysaccharide deacetylase family protein [Reyranella sp.]|uniref:polysaccharide deacetylase family protein n=1 Tax=Reyranella sp. TaxID=1929291 RepID=UPI001AC8AB13|nr:polysaccharide deacetylase family protein [Reyranella sp.]MBN9088025.1 polysaccharide deacetylase family protein [Reyranella sp.]